jgi:hypothetical protein
MNGGFAWGLAGIVGFAFDRSCHYQYGPFADLDA